jgi:phage terminase large subunit
MEVEIAIPEKLLFFHEEAWRYKVAFGGRGSAKSWTVADALILRAVSRPQRILCAREFQRSIADSVHHLLETQIDRMGLRPAFDVHNTSIACKPTGSEFIFTGLKHNIKSLKSCEGIDVCWVEEAEAVSDESWENLIPTIRKSGSEIWITFNPDQETDPTYQRFIVNPPPKCKSAKVSWRDNPDLPDVLKDELEHLRRTDPDAYAHVWEGGCWTRSDAQIFNGKWVIDDFEPVAGSHRPEANWNGPYQGADWGFSSDPTVLLKMWVHNKRLYVEHEAYKVGCDIVDTPKLFDSVPNSRRYVIRADSARPETINHVRRAGFHIEPATKWPKSVEDGITLLRSFEKIVIHPRCKNMVQEARLYSYKTDKLTGDVLPDIIDRHNHCWDAARYGLLPLIRRRAPARIRSVYAPGRWI